MLIIITLSHILALNVCAATVGQEPVVVVDPQTSIAKEVVNQSQTLLIDARQRKLTGEAGYGDQYRRAAWAAIEETPDDLLFPVSIIQELLAGPETVFDVFDAYRILGQLHNGKMLWSSASDYYSQANILAEADPALINSHPRVYISIMQGLSLSKASQGDYSAAAQADITLRDHTCLGIPREIQRAAAISATEHLLQASDEPGCIAAWQHIEEYFPEKFQGREGVFWRMEKAQSLSLFTSDLATQLELVWERPDIRQFDSCLHLVLLLSGEWADQTDNPLNLVFAYDVLTQGWDTILENEAGWIASYGDDQQQIDSLKNMTKMVLSDILNLAIRLELFEEALPLAVAYSNRYGVQDSRAAIWLQMVQSQLP